MLYIPLSLVSLPQITRKVIRKYFSPDGVEREEVTVEGSHQEMVSVEEGDGFSKVVKRTVVRSEGDQTEVSLSVCVSVCCLCVYRLCLGSIFQYFWKWLCITGFTYTVDIMMSQGCLALMWNWHRFNYFVDMKQTIIIPLQNITFPVYAIKPTS